MSNGYAIAAVTRTLRALLTGATGNVTMQPPDKARDDAAAQQLNLFLYNTPVAGAFRNSDPAGLRLGESGAPPLPLTLHYLITAYGADEANAHEVLGKAMRILHDHTLLSPQEIVDANRNEDASEVDKQIERLKITLLPLSIHDMSELWTGFATNYRPSAAYEVSAVLIDSTKTPRTPLPVLQPGPAAVTGGDATLTAALPPERASVATLGATVRVLGSNLAAVTGFELLHPRWPKPAKLQPVAVSDQECDVRLPTTAPAADAPLLSGFYQISAVTERPGLPRVVSNTVPIGLGPKITKTSPMANVSAGEVTVTVECRPPTADKQVVHMLLGSAIATPTQIVTPAGQEFSTVTAKFAQVVKGTYTVRLRVDRVDSDPVRYTSTPGAPPVPQFDPAVQVVVVP